MVSLESLINAALRMSLDCVRKAENPRRHRQDMQTPQSETNSKHLDCHCQDVTCSAKTHLSMFYILLVKLCGTGPKHFSRETRDRTKCHWWSEVRLHVLSKLSIKTQWKTLWIKRSGTRDLNVKVHFIIFFISCNGCCSECCLPQEHPGRSYLNKPHGYCLYYFQYASFYISTYSGLLCHMTAEKRVKLMSAQFLGRNGH